MYEIRTSDYVKVKTISIDGNIWTMKSLGAGEDLALSQSQRRLKQLQKKIDNDTATDEEYKQYDKLEQRLYDVFSKIFKDETEDNSQVKEWIENTPLDSITAIFQDINEQAKQNETGKELPQAKA